MKLECYDTPTTPHWLGWTCWDDSRTFVEGARGWGGTRRAIRDYMILFRSSDIGALPRRLLIERRGLFREIPFFLAGGKARRPISGRRRIISADDIGYPELISADVIGYPELTSSFALMLDIIEHYKLHNTNPGEYLSTLLRLQQHLRGLHKT